MSALGGLEKTAVGSDASSPPSPFVWTCPVCLTESDDTACDGCGRPLTRRDLTPDKRPPAAPSTVMSGARPAEGDES